MLKNWMFLSSSLSLKFAYNPFLSASIQRTLQCSNLFSSSSSSSSAASLAWLEQQQLGSELQSTFTREIEGRKGKEGRRRKSSSQKQKLDNQTCFSKLKFTQKDAIVTMNQKGKGKRLILMYLSPVNLDVDSTL